jgi:hypothetical protein
VIEAALSSRGARLLELHQRSQRGPNFPAVSCYEELRWTLVDMMLVDVMLVDMNNVDELRNLFHNVVREISRAEHSPCVPPYITPR